MTAGSEEGISPKSLEKNLNPPKNSFISFAITTATVQKRSNKRYFSRKCTIRKGVGKGKRGVGR